MRDVKGLLYPNGNDDLVGLVYNIEIVDVINYIGNRSMIEPFYSLFLYSKNWNCQIKNISLLQSVILLRNLIINRMSSEKIARQIRKKYKMVTSLVVNYTEGEDHIELLGMRYSGDADNFATENQIRFLSSFNNVDCSKWNLSESNKWFMSACIDIARSYPSQKFKIHV